MGPAQTLASTVDAFVDTPAFHFRSVDRLAVV